MTSVSSTEFEVESADLKWRARITLIEYDLMSGVSVFDVCKEVLAHGCKRVHIVTTRSPDRVDTLRTVETVLPPKVDQAS